LKEGHSSRAEGNRKNVGEKEERDEEGERRKKNESESGGK
jgi:hypothetical protein